MPEEGDIQVLVHKPHVPQNTALKLCCLAAKISMAERRPGHVDYKTAGKKDALEMWCWRGLDCIPHQQFNFKRTKYQGTTFVDGAVTNNEVFWPHLRVPRDFVCVSVNLKREINAVPDFFQDFKRVTTLSLLCDPNPRPWTQKARSLPAAPIGRQNYNGNSNLTQIHQLNPSTTGTANCGTVRKYRSCTLRAHVMNRNRSLLYWGRGRTNRWFSKSYT
ncbi:jg15444 [Pararge aegeria aegeria]|uniref:Jg15444 protein n=1 Tax=Pararge aegeria aegeria TaxID=348720 RepID=A0A8S4SCB6_9NEOP|nr:jg15444 [Pararge aegeria aegeria]